MSRSTARLFLALARPKVSLAVGLGSLAGAAYYGLSYESYTIHLPAVLMAAAGALATTAGCSALNQVQERGRDAHMARTARRPLPSGELTPGPALVFGSTLITLGLALFALSGGLSLLLTGGAVVVVYNGLYTPLKPKTPLALLAGGVAGALPPLTGWLAAGGPLADPRVLALIALFYLWQVPHFWLLAEKRRADYLRAGFALFGAGISEARRRALLQLWVGAYFLGVGCFLVSETATRTAAFPVVSLLGTLGCLAAGALACLWLAQGRTAQASRVVDISLPLALVAPMILSMFG